MRWIGIGGYAHAVLHGRDKTLCGHPVARADRIMPTPGFDNRCRYCDERWRDAGRKAKKPLAVDRRAVYTPRFTYADWEMLP
jgi:hypothetical protein